jgi:hypothetical protein
MALVVGLIAEGLVLHPFGIPTTLFAQTQTLAQSGDLRGLAVDGNTKRFFRTVRRLITANSDYRLGDPIVSAYDLPGLVYVLGGVSPGAPWFFADGPQQQRNCAELRSTHLAKLSRAIVIVQPTIWPSFSACLRTVKINFPDHYRLAGTVRSPYDGKVVNVYVPLAVEQKRTGE